MRFIIGHFEEFYNFISMQEKRMVVFVEASVLEDPALARDPRFQSVRDKLQTFRDGTDDLQVITY